MSTRVMAAPVSLNARMLLLPSQFRLDDERPRIVPSTGCLSRVKRCLFGLPSSPGEALQQAAAELQRQTESDSKRWNFKFDDEKPMDGRFQWQPAEPQCNRVEPNDPVSPSAPLRQCLITEFLQPRKRTASGSMSSNNNKRLRLQSSPQARRS